MEQENKKDIDLDVSKQAMMGNTPIVNIESIVNQQGTNYDLATQIKRNIRKNNKR